MLSVKFPLLANYVETSSATGDYNCIAWACGDNTKWWWPDVSVYWPPGIRCDETLDAFHEMFVSGGAHLVISDALEPGITKIALFALGLRPTHAARQLSNGMWTSKLGSEIDIAHSLKEIEGVNYGTVARMYAVALNPSYSLGRGQVGGERSLTR